MRVLKICFMACLLIGSFDCGKLLADISLTGTSLTLNFDDIGSGLPTGVSVRTGANATSLGTAASFASTATSWADGAGAFKNFSSDNIDLASAAAVQGANSNRALGVRQSGSFGDPGASFNFRLSNTAGFENFNWSVRTGVLSQQTRQTVWTFQYGIGDSPATWTTLGQKTADSLGLSATGSTFSNIAGLANINQVVWLRVVALAPSTGSGTRDSFGIDDFNLSYSAVPEPTSMLLLGFVGFGGLAIRRFRR